MTDAVYEPAYEAYEGERTSRSARVWVMARRSLERVFSSTWLWVLVALTLVHVGIRGVGLYATGQGLGPFSGADVFTAEFLTSFLATQARWFVTLALVAVGAGAIAEDLQTGGLVFHLTKPVTKPGYLAGKLAGPVTAALVLTALPVLVVWTLGVAFIPEAAHPANVALFPLTLTAASIVIAATTSLIVLALSALLGSRWPAALAWIAVAFVLAGAGRIVENVTGEAAYHLVDLFTALDATTRTLVGAEATQVPEVGAGLVVAGWIVASLAGLFWTLQGREVGS